MQRDTKHPCLVKSSNMGAHFTVCLLHACKAQHTCKQCNTEHKANRSHNSETFTRVGLN